MTWRKKKKKKVTTTINKFPLIICLAVTHLGFGCTHLKLFPLVEELGLFRADDKLPEIILSSGDLYVVHRKTCAGGQAPRGRSRSPCQVD